MLSKKDIQFLQEHPYLIDLVRKIGKTELRKIIRREGIPKFSKILEGARQKMGIPYEDFVIKCGWDYRHESEWVHFTKLRIKQKVRAIRNFLAGRNQH